MMTAEKPQPGLIPGFGMQKNAVLSECRQYRYFLYRIWNEKAARLAVVGLNPSTADEDHDDATVRQCMAYARRWGMGGLYMLNLFGWRATDPRALLKAVDPVGEENDTHLLTYCLDADLILAAWGVGGGLLDRDRAVLRLLDGLDVMCLGTTKEGYPRHPLRNKLTLKPVKYEGR